MKTILNLALFLTIAITLQAGEEWLTDPVKAKAQAIKENKVILADFTGSDWCPPCKNLKASVLGTDVFTEYAKKKLVLLELDYPHHTEQPAEIKAQNAKLKQRFRITGFPTVILLDKNSKELARWVGYGGESPEAYIAKIEAALAKQVATAD
jgi:thioredoxin-related protein